MNRSMVQSVTKNNQLVEDPEKSEEIELEGLATRAYTFSSTASSTSSYVTASTSTGPPPVSKKNLRLAILAHIQAIRTLGRNEINTQEIADALCISVQEVNDALEGLRKQGVRRR